MATSTRCSFCFNTAAIIFLNQHLVACSESRVIGETRDRELLPGKGMN